MPVDLRKLKRALNPRTVAVVGDRGIRGYHWLRNMSTAKKLYSVQVDEKEIPGIEALGIPNYKSLMDIPDEIDYVLVAVPRSVAPIVLKDCIAKKVGGAAFFSSGFAETNTDEGKSLQDSLAQMAMDSGLILVGPNCMGLYNPAAGVRFNQRQPVGFKGNVTFISQSGSHGSDFSLLAAVAGIKINKVVSFGNGIVLENSDYLEYFASDPETRYIAMYVEGLKDGRRFFDLLHRTTPHKPVILWKGGLTQSGQRATASHTASMAGSSEIWDAMSRQCGALQAESVSEVVDLLKGLTLLPICTKDGIGLTGGAGGQSVSMSDAFSLGGLQVPPLSQSSYDRLSQWFSVVGASYHNPIDMGSNRQEIQTIMDLLTADPNINWVVTQIRPSGDGPDAAQVEAQIAALAHCKNYSTKPFVVILHSTDPVGEATSLSTIEQRLAEIGIPSYPTYQRAARSIKKILDYYQFHHLEPEEIVTLDTQQEASSI